MPQGIDPESEQKIAAARNAFISELNRHRPRFASAFSSMHVSGNRIGITVPTTLLRDDIVQHQKEIISLLCGKAGLNGTVEISVEVREDKGAIRPVKPEDKLAYLRSKNAALDELRRELDLEIE